MHAIRVTDDGALVWGETPRPPLQPGHVRIRVRATAVNRADLLQRVGRYPPPPGKSEILGLEAAGEVAEVGANAHRWQHGERVCGLLAGGGYAEEVVCPEGHLLPVPAGMSWEEAAALPEALTTAWLNLYREAGLRTGERVLLHAGASGVGTIAIQLCAVMGNPCWVTAGSDEKIARTVDLGAEAGANRHREDFAERVAAWTGGHGMDVILDPVGGDYLDANLRSLAPGGRLVLIGLMGGRRGEIDLGRLLVKRLRVVGSVLRGRSDAEKTDIIEGLQDQAWPYVEARRIRPVIDRVLPITEAERAHAAISANGTVGKVVLTVP